MRDIKSRIKLTFLLLVLTISLNSDTKKYSDFNLIHIYKKNTDKFTPFASYKDRNIYIGSINYINEVNKIASVNDILLIDERCFYDANMRVCNSYKITDEKDIENILKILSYYETLSPSNWNRSLISMKNEWNIHNIAYYMGYQKDRTESVDFNNFDELNYNNTENILLTIKKEMR